MRKIPRPNIAQFARSESGSIMTIWAVSLAVFLGLLALTFDFGRMASTQSELQGYVDNVALAAAGELDGNADAIDRATVAAAQMISDTQTFGTGGTDLIGEDDYSISFHSQLPTAANDFLTTDPREARFVQIVSSGQNVDRGFSAAFVALTGEDGIEEGVGANAIAGYTQSACDITPFMYCIPSAEFRANDNIGAVIRLRAGGQEAGWGPGAFGFLDPSAGQTSTSGVCAGLQGANLDICLLGAAGERTGCFASNGVSIAAGQKVGNFQAAVNTRFDVFLGGAQQLRNKAEYAPAPNVIKGRIPGQSNTQCLAQVSLDAPTMGLPEDDCQTSGTCGRFGDGDWSTGRAAYVNANYGGIDPHPQAVTRYDYYLAEIAAAGGPSSTSPILNSPISTETGRPQCSPYQSTDPGRRVMVAAGIDCVNNPVSGGATNIPVKEFAEIFIIQPMGLDPLDMEKDLYVEILGSGGSALGGNSPDAIFRDVVRLYK